MGALRAAGLLWALGAVAANARVSGLAEPTYRIPAVDSHVAPDFIFPMIRWSGERGAIFELAATLSVTVTNAPATVALVPDSAVSASAARSVFAMVVCPSSVSDTVQLTLPAAPGVNPGLADVCMRDAFIRTSAFRREPTAASCGHVFMHPSAFPTNSSPFDAGPPRVVSAHATFELAATAMVVPEADSWTVFLSACGMTDVQNMVISFNEEHDACRNEALRRAVDSTGAIGNLSIGGHLVDCGQRADPFTWALSANTSISARQAGGEQLQAGDMWLLVTRPGFLGLELAATLLFAARLCAARARQSLRLHNSLLAAMAARVVADVVFLAGLRTIAVGATYETQRKVLLPVLFTASAVATVAIATMAFLVTSGWQLLFAELPRSGLRAGLAATLLAALALTSANIIGTPEQPPLPSNLQPPSTGSELSSRLPSGEPEGSSRFGGSGMGPWMAALVVAACACCAAAAYSLSYGANTAVATASFRMEAVWAIPSGRRRWWLRALIDQQMRLIASSRRDAMLTLLACMAMALAATTTSDAAPFRWVPDAIFQASLCAFLLGVSHNFRPRRVHAAALSAQVAPETASNAVQQEQTLRLVLSIPAVDGPTGPANLRHASREHLVRRLLGQDDPASCVRGLPPLGTKADLPAIVLIVRPASRPPPPHASCTSARAAATPEAAPDNSVASGLLPGAAVSHGPSGATLRPALALGCSPASATWIDGGSTVARRRPGDSQGPRDPVSARLHTLLRRMRGSQTAPGAA